MTEWAVQYKTFIDGDFDRVQATRLHGPWTERSAREYVRKYNKGRGEVSRVVSRQVTEWAP